MRDELINARGDRTQMQISKELNISQKYLSKLELEQRNPSLKLAFEISKFYNISVEVLFPDIFLRPSTP